MPIDRAEAELLGRLKPFAEEDRARTWRATLSTLGLVVAAGFVAGAARHGCVRATASILEGLLLVRGFSIFHDAMHGAVFRGSSVGRSLWSAFGLLVLTPSRAWRDSHNYHHAKNGQIVGSQIGAYPVMTVAMWTRATRSQKMRYRLARHPLGIAFGYLTTFAHGMCIAPFLRDPKVHFAGPVALALHGVLLAGTWRLGGPSLCASIVVVPMGLATALGSYLFYAQHNFPSVRIRPRERWTYASAAVEYASYLEAGPVFAWLTGNIGVHHVHHLNPLVPFYRLYEAMRGVPELRTPPNNSLHPAHVLACFRGNLWSPEDGRMVPYPNERAA
ncbi:MAG TPA: fatty acid desaturase [Polyangiaceae bacterium]|jgi:omega-6 fatty acid desaturase (delta-12 desaturase)